MRLQTKLLGIEGRPIVLHRVRLKVKVIWCVPNVHLDLLGRIVVRVVIFNQIVVESPDDDRYDSPLA